MKTKKIIRRQEDKMPQGSNKGKRSRSRGPRTQEGSPDLFELLYCREDDEINGTSLAGRNVCRHIRLTFT